LISQTRSRDDLIGRIRLKIESAHVQGHLAGDGPNMHLVQCCGKRLMMEPVSKPTQLMQHFGCHLQHESRLVRGQGLGVPIFTSGLISLSAS
jgi:hypothetical protein